MNPTLLDQLNAGDIAFDTEGSSLEQIMEVVQAAFPDDRGYIPIFDRDINQYIVYWSKSESFDRRLWIDRVGTKLPSYTYFQFKNQK